MAMMPVTTTKSAVPKPKPTPRERPPVTPLPIEVGPPFIKVGCRVVWLDKAGTWRRHEGSTPSKHVASLMVGDEDTEIPDENCTDAKVDFERFMLSMYALAHRQGIPIPRIPPKPK